MGRFTGITLVDRACVIANKLVRGDYISVRLCPPDLRNCGGHPVGKACKHAAGMVGHISKEKNN